MGNLTWGTNKSYGILVKANKWGGISRGLTFRNLKITDVFGISMREAGNNEFIREWYEADGIIFWADKNDLESSPMVEVGIEDVMIEDCEFYNLGGMGIAMTKPTNVRNNPIDDEDRFKNFVIRNNTFEKLGDGGIVFISIYNGLAEFNDFIDMGWGDFNAQDRYLGRGEGIWTWDARNIIVQFNRSYRARGVGDSYGVGHIDFFSHNNIFQYNYSEDTEAAIQRK